MTALQIQESRIGSFWFQKYGYFDKDKQVWIPFQPLPEFFELPGPLNIYLRPDAKQFIESGELKAIERRWSRELWPRISKSMRKFYIEKRRPSLRKFHDELWPRLQPIKGFAKNDLKKKFGLDNGDEFRLDHYGNVLALKAEKSSLTQWDVDHIFPYSKGGLSKLGNLRIILSRANRIVKRDRFEALIQPEKMKIGISVEQLYDLEKKYKKDPQKLYDYLTKTDKKIESKIDFYTEQYVKQLKIEEMLCDYCFEKQALHRCKDCKQYQYCSNECHKYHWYDSQSTHKKHCKKTRIETMNDNSILNSFETLGQQTVSRNDWCADVSILQKLSDDRKPIEVNVATLEYILDEELWEDEDENPISPNMVTFFFEKIIFVSIFNISNYF